MAFENQHASACCTTHRLQVKGKFLYLNGEKFYIKGVTYGTFAPDTEGLQFPKAEVMEQDFASMAVNGINSIRTYTVPPTSLLDIAEKNNLKVMVGLPWEQHITFLEKPDSERDITRRVKEGVASCNQHPAILCYAVGNEIPAPIVRWYGKKKIEKFLKTLFSAVKQVDANSLVTYVNFPTTEYLDVSFMDFDCFNVYLETPGKLGAYISRLHNLSGDRPLVLAEIGLDSLRNGTDVQADTLTWQIQTIFGKGCAGMFVFAWTDEWWRGGHEIEDWDFGVVDRNRLPKPALAATSKNLASVPYVGGSFPFFSVVVCTYNGSLTIKDTLTHLTSLSYPNYEIIVVNDGSTDHTEEIIREFSVQLINTKNRGLSNARNTGMHNAKGEIIAYIDDDAYPDPHWLHYLAYTYNTSKHGAMGGPNIAPYEDGPIATCVANAPGGPVHVLISDEIAEHVPGCNLSVRKEVLLRIGGFDPIYRCAGDDVDVCWRIQESGETIGFHPSAVVWHHRRNSLKTYWKQQQGYGKAEALLEAKWPEKYNGFGHLSWQGRIYGNGLTLPIKIKKDRIFHGTWGTALFQSVYQPAEGFLAALPLMPEWYILTALTTIIACLGFLWSPLLWVWAFVIASFAIILIQATISSSKSVSLQPAQRRNYKYRLLIALLHVVQPIARLYGRFKHGLTPWRKRGAGFQSKFLFVVGSRIFLHWSEQWRPAEDWLTEFELKLKELKTRVKRGGCFDAWDLQVRNGLFSKSRGLLTIEEHGAGKQYLRFRCWAHYSSHSFVVIGLLITLCTWAGINSQFAVSFLLGLMVVVITFRLLFETASSMNSLYSAFKLLGDEQPVPESVPIEHRIKVNQSIPQGYQETAYDFNNSFLELPMQTNVNIRKSS